MKKLVLLMIVAMVTLSAHAGRKKFIGHSWDLLRLPPEVIASNIDKLEQLPLDGISIKCTAKAPSGKSYSFNSAMVSPKWERTWVEHLIPTLNKINGGRLKHNLITAFFAPQSRLRWNDDERWAIIANNMGIIAWLAKTTGARGILLDPEDYPRTRQYTYNPTIDKGTYAENAVLARRRGGQVMKAIAAEYPDAVVLSFWLISMNPTLMNQGVDASQAMEAQGNLWVPFINGLLDEALPKMKLVDGCENAYRYDFESYDFIRTALLITRAFAYVVAPENRVKYCSQVQASFGLYLDMYVNKEGSSWYFPPYKGSRLKRLIGNFTQAMFACDEYCWVYGEKYNWVKWDYPADFNVKKVSFAGRMSDTETWNDALPGIWRAMEIIRDPQVAYMKIFKEKSAAGALVNLVQNANCLPAQANGAKDTAAKPFDWESKGLPSGWSSWEMTPKGKFSIDTQLKIGESNSVRLEGVEQGCAIVRTNVEPAGTYAVEVMAKGKNPSLSIRWQKDGAWRAHESDVMATFGPAGEDGWQVARTIITVPENANQLVMLLNGRLASGETVNYAKPAVYKIELE
ncbi:MAG: hypothetical protein J6X55_14415 [Victivallales bacterium]|nr:hypothetical protein [Victivallales bacterium]